MLLNSAHAVAILIVYTTPCRCAVLQARRQIGLACTVLCIHAVRQPSFGELSVMRTHTLYLEKWLPQRSRCTKQRASAQTSKDVSVRTEEQSLLRVSSAGHIFV